MKTARPIGMGARFILFPLTASVPCVVTAWCGVEGYIHPTPYTLHPPHSSLNSPPYSLLPTPYTSGQIGRVLMLHTFIRCCIRNEYDSSLGHWSRLHDF